jgi:hypothetical protein
MIIATKPTKKHKSWTQVERFGATPFGLRTKVINLTSIPRGSGFPAMKKSYAKVVTVKSRLESRSYMDDA